MKKYKFWFLVAVSLLLVVTFAMYLPTRFEQEATHATGEHAEHGAGEQAHHTLPDASAIAELPLRTPAARADRLAYTIDQDGTKVFRMEASEFRWEYEPGKWIHAWGYNGQIPGPEIRVTEGDKVRVIVTNSLPEATSVHWHSLDVQWEADGVPNLTQAPIEPGETYVYEFVARPGGETGTRFYHSHGKNHITAAQQMDMGLSGPFVIEPKQKELAYDREYTLLLDEWDVLEGGVNAAVAHVHGAGEEGAVPEYNTFTINGRIFPYIDPIRVKEGENVLIRVINAGTTAFHPMHTHGHNFQLVALDGNVLSEVAWQKRSTYTVHPGETADFLLTADNPGNWLFHCHHVHHAAAGMIMLVEYEGFVGPSTQDLRDMMQAANMAPEDSHEHASGTPEDHHEEETMEDHAHAPDTSADHHDDGEEGEHEHEKEAIRPLVSSQWWLYLAVSVLLLALLSFGVHRFISVKK